MEDAKAKFRLGQRDDAAVLADLVNCAGEGLPIYLWGKLAAAGQTGWDVGRTRAARDEGSFSYRNATLIEHDGRVAGCLIGYVIPLLPAPVSSEMPAMFVPMQELENAAPATWYVNVLSVLPTHRNRGMGSDLLRLADETGRALGQNGMSVIVSDANTGARRLYEKHGYMERDRRKMIKEGWSNNGEEWVLLTKSL
jgi:ribosomal protein S18 acetylase RimI-like enzyme